jgi:hypothetical protein
MAKNRIKKAVEGVKTFLGKEIIPDKQKEVVSVEAVQEQAVEQITEPITETPKEEIVTQKEQKRVTATESEQLQKKGWKVVSMEKENGQRIHILEKA